MSTSESWDVNRHTARCSLIGFPRLLESPGFFLKIPVPGKSWKLQLKVLESREKISLKVMHFSSGSNGKQAAIV